MYDLRVVVEEIKGFCDLPVKVGDFFEVRGGRLLIPEGGHVCIWALQSMMPLLPVKQRRIAEENDWIPYTSRICCPDPNGQVIYRIEQLPRAAEAGQDTQSAQGPEGSQGASSARAEVAATAAGLASRTAAAVAASPTVPTPAVAATPPTVVPRMLVDAKACAGCRACELACSFVHTGSFTEAAARILVRKDDAMGSDEPVVCRQCGVARCVEACPEEALRRDPATKAVVVDEERCTGCGRCASACPFKVIRFVDDFPLICDLCGGEPQCVKRCPTGAIRYGTAGAIRQAG